MAALTGYRNTKIAKGSAIADVLAIPIADNVKVYVGGMVALNILGQAVPAGSTTAVGPAIGRAEPPYQPQPSAVNGSPNSVYDNTVTGHTAGALTVLVRQGIFKWNNSTGVDLISQTQVGLDCYAVDDQTVAATPGAGRSRAGKVAFIDPDGTPWISQGLFQQNGYSGQLITLPVTLASLVVGGGTIAGPFTPGFFGRIQSLIYVPCVSGAGSGATMGVSIQIGGVATTGGVCTITLANTAYAAAPVAGSAITALNTFGPASTITLVNAAGTVFTAGSGYFLLQLA